MSKVPSLAARSNYIVESVHQPINRQRPSIFFFLSFISSLRGRSNQLDNRLVASSDWLLAQPYCAYPISWGILYICIHGGSLGIVLKKQFQEATTNLSLDFDGYYLPYVLGIAKAVSKAQREWVGTQENRGNPTFWPKQCYWCQACFLVNKPYRRMKPNIRQNSQGKAPSIYLYHVNLLSGFESSSR